MANVYSNARNTYYAISGFPTYFFDGVLSVVGGSGTSSMYSSYVPKVNARNAIQSDFTIDLEFEATDADYNATVTVENVGGNTMSNLVLHFVVTESKLPIVWGLTLEQDFTNRLMVPNQNGTPLNFSGSTTQVVNLNFNTSYWDVDNCELIAFVQNNTTKEVLQGTKVFMAIPLFTIDAEAKEIKHPTDLYCGSSVEPIVLIKNKGADNLTSVDIEYSINGGASETYNWTGDLGFNLGEEVTLPEISFTPQAVNTIEVTVSNPNGLPDQNPDNDNIMEDFEAAPQIESSTVLFELKTDQYPSETTWKVRNSAGTVMFQGGPYSQANTIFNVTWDLPDTDCYTFTIYDQYGDGICCAYGIGYYKIKDENNTVLIQGGEFGSEESKPFERSGEAVLTANFLADQTSIVEGESVEFTDLSSGAISIWLWEFEGGTPAISSEQNPTVTYALEGTYDVTLTISDGTNTASETKVDYIIVDHITGIGENGSNGVNVFPNPTSGLIYVSGISNAQVKVYNNTGSIVEEVKQTATGSIDLSDLENGIYFIQILGDDNTVISKKINLLK